MDYGKAIKIRRAELDISQEEIANKVGTTKQNISRYETGKVKDPDYRMLKEIFQFLQLDFAPYAKHLPPVRTTTSQPSAPLDQLLEQLQEKLAKVEQEKSEALKDKYEWMQKYTLLLEQIVRPKK